MASLDGQNPSAWRATRLQGCREVSAEDAE
jgi:hypothetical protein